MILIVGLGNPGKKYEKTRHNAGFLAVAYIYNQLATYNPQPWQYSKKHQADLAIFKNSHKEIKQINDDILLVKPRTFMNNSGLAVKSLIAHYSLLVSDLIIIHDDIDIKLGKFKIQTGRSSAGHNGVKSIIDHIKTKDFMRIRLGVLSADIDKTELETSKYVLKKFNKQEIKILDSLYPQIFKELKL